MKKKLIAFCMLLPTLAWADTHPRAADLRVLDRVNARAQTIEAPINRAVRYNNLEITVRACRPGDDKEGPSAGARAFVEVQEVQRQGPPKSIFSGWMLAGSPAANALDHPVYDVWLIACKA